MAVGVDCIAVVRDIVVFARDVSPPSYVGMMPGIEEWRERYDAIEASAGEREV